MHAYVCGCMCVCVFKQARQMMQYQQSPSTVPMNMAGKNERDKMAVNTVWVGRLTKTTTETSLRHFFRDFAPYITSVHLKPGERKGDQYAFVNFASLSEARRAMKNLQGKQVDDCRSVMLRIDENLDNDHFRRLHQANVGLPRALRVFAQSIGFNFSRYARMDMRHIAVPKGLQGTGGATIPRVGVPACLWIGNLKPNTSEGDVRRLLSTWLLHISGIRLTLQRASLLCFSFVDFDTKVSAFDCYMYFAVRESYGLVRSWSLCTGHFLFTTLENRNSHFNIAMSSRAGKRICRMRWTLENA